MKAPLYRTMFLKQNCETCGEVFLFSLRGKAAERRATCNRCMIKFVTKWNCVERFREFSEESYFEQLAAGIAAG